MANIVGRNYLTRYYEADEAGRAVLIERLDYCLTKKYISPLEYDRAIAGLPPEGYVPSPAKLAADSQTATAD